MMSQKNQLFFVRILFLLSSSTTTCINNYYAIAAQTTEECFSNLDEIALLEADLSTQEVIATTPTQKREIILCPNTVYVMRQQQQQDVGVGFQPIKPRPNSYYKCGIDGSSYNNCIIQGGDFAILSIDDSSQQQDSKDKEEDSVGIVFEGLIFEMATKSTAIFAKRGDFTFIDCIFRNQQNHLGTIIILFGSDDEITNLRNLDLLLDDDNDEEVKDENDDGEDDGTIDVEQEGDEEEDNMLINHDKRILLNDEIEHDDSNRLTVQQQDNNNHHQRYLYAENFLSSSSSLLRRIKSSSNHKKTFMSKVRGLSSSSSSPHQDMYLSSSNPVASQQQISSSSSRNLHHHRRQLMDDKIEETPFPSEYPTEYPTEEPTKQPKVKSTKSPTFEPTETFSSEPSLHPSFQPTSTPTETHSSSPTVEPSPQISETPSLIPSSIPTIQPTDIPTVNPSIQPTDIPSLNPSTIPSPEPTSNPSESPSYQPSLRPSTLPSSEPTIDTSTLTITFVQTVFENIKLGTDEPNNSNEFARNGIISAESERTILIFEDVMFRNNTSFLGVVDDGGDDEEKMQQSTTTTWGIKTLGPLTINECCFTNNEFYFGRNDAEGGGLLLDGSNVITVGYPPLNVSNNYAVANVDNAICPFLIQVPYDDDDFSNTVNSGVFTCIDPDASVCHAENPPTFAPSEMPSYSPSSSPVDPPSYWEGFDGRETEMPTITSSAGGSTTRWKANLVGLYSFGTASNVQFYFTLMSMEVIMALILTAVVV